MQNVTSHLRSSGRILSMRNAHKSLTILLFLIFCCPSAWSQVTEEEKTVAVKRAQEFSQRLRKVQDLKPLLNEFFAPQFMSQIHRERGFTILAFLDLPGEKEIKLTPASTRRYYLATLNWSYLLWLYNCSKNPTAFNNEDSITAETLFPAAARKTLDDTPLLKYIKESSTDYFDDEHPEKNYIPRSAADVQKMTRNAEKMNIIFRDHLKDVAQMSDESFIRLVGKCQDPDKPYSKIEMVKCDKSFGCAGLPKTAELIGVPVPFFSYLDFMHINRKMKIVRLLMWDESIL